MDNVEETIDLFDRIQWDIDDWIAAARAHVKQGNMIEAQKDVACADNGIHYLWEKLG